MISESKTDDYGYAVISLSRKKRYRSLRDRNQWHKKL